MYDQSGGWIKLHRDILNHWIWKDTEKFHWWLELLFMANWEDGKVLVGNTLVNVKRGQMLASNGFLSRRWQVHPDTVRSFLRLLESDNMITQEAHSKFNLITICNYVKYQDVTNLNSEVNTNPNAEVNTDPNTDPNKEYKNIRSKEELKRDTIVSPKKGKFDFLASLISLDVEEQVAKDWMKVRTAKKASDSSTAFKQLETALNKILQTYGISHNDAIRVCVTNGWYGCKESYFSNIRLSDYNITPAGQASLFDANTNQKTQWE